MIRDRALSVAEAFRNVYPVTNTARTNMGNSSSNVGFSAGRDAGRSANIGQSTVSGGRKAISS